ncbi:MAG: triose-phosphate isomerase [Coriobacteriia bacterium]|nr:triose-phosphate isomerase [Coriobacteriia bacterium]
MDERMPLIVANWKMNKTVSESKQLANEIINQINQSYLYDIDVVLCPTFVSLASLSDILREKRSALLLGAQDVYPADDGAFTGAVNARMLADNEVDFCIIGHSERRRYFNESDDDVATKLEALINMGISPVLCLGESLEVRESGPDLAIEFVLRQLKDTVSQVALSGSDWALAGLVIAYEPIWSIGTGLTASAETAQEMAHAIRGELASLLGEPAGQTSRILYGGSVNASNAGEFALLDDIDGCLVGGASLDAGEFSELVATYYLKHLQYIHQ